ncbi:MAG: hypothetical protein MUP71_10645 [Candidatus Aminicenantes bacterium]|nr:hypothetical protein [Candidatus Aminicenantes bacterium]
MGKRENDIKALLLRCESDLKTIKKSYSISLNAQQVSTGLLIDIKNFFENLRSILDYIAHDIREKYCLSADPKAKFYFPISSTKMDFETKTAKWFPGLKGSSPDFWEYLECVQPYNKGFHWLAVFNKINNENKHGSLVAQTRTEIEQVHVSFPNGEVNWIPGNVRFSQGVFIGGVPVDPKTQMPVPHPSQKVERVIWVDFHFTGENFSVIDFLNECHLGISKIVEVTERWL